MLVEDLGPSRRGQPVPGELTRPVLAYMDDHRFVAVFADPYRLFDQLM